MNIEIAQRLQKLRKENGYSQEELADKLGISRQAVSKWERAESSPDTDNLIILARLYNMSLDELLYDNETTEEIKERVMDKEDSIKESNSISLTDDEGQTLKIENGKVEFLNPDGTKEEIDKKKIAIVSLIDSIIFTITLILYLFLSITYNIWDLTWPLWILMPSLMSIAEAISKKMFTKFLYPFLVTAIYCYLGMTFSLWHPFWFLFVTIPAYYIFANIMDKYCLKTKTEDDED